MAIEVLQLLLEKGANLSAPYNDGMTVLHLAASHGDKKFVQLLLESEVNKSILDKDGRTVLHWAAYGGHGTVQFLLENGAATPLYPYRIVMEKQPFTRRYMGLQRRRPAAVQTPRPLITME